MIALREIGFEDLDQARRLTSVVGWGAPTREDWERLWIRNPAHDGNEPPLARGWVLEEGGRVQGMALCIAQAYRLAKRRLRAAIFAGLVVEPEARGSTMKLVAAYVRQKADLLLSPGSAPETVKLLGFMKLAKMPQPEYDVTCYWVTRPLGFLAAGFRKKGLPRALGLPAAFAGAPVLWAENRLRRRPRLGAAKLEVAILAPEHVDARFDELWERKTREGEKLLAERTAETIRWHFSRPVAERPFIVAACAGRRIEGYAAVVRQDAPHLGLARARIADLIVAKDDPETTRQLLGAAIREAGKRGAHMVELVGFPREVRAVAEELRPYKLGSPAWPFHYRAPDPALHTRLASPDVWHASLFDGDGSL